MEHNHYKNQNLYLSSAIIASGIPLADYSFDRKTATFYFESPEKCREIEKAWSTNQLQVSAYNFSEAIRQLKAIIHGGN